MSIDDRILRAFSEENGFPLEPHLLVLALMGSKSHGTYMPPDEPDGIDDVDLMGFVVPPLEYHLGLPRWHHWVFKHEELDVVLYGLDKAFRLLLKGNPNIVGVLWLRDEDYVHCHPAFHLLRERRDLFSSQAASDAFTGYAAAQLKQMQAFNLERIADYEAMTTRIEAKGSVRLVLEADSAQTKHLSALWQIPAETLLDFKKLHRQHFSSYMGAKRKALVRRFQYDVKNAAHLIRLLRMGTEFLATGRLKVFREEDADELKRIKRGGWTLEQVKAEAQRLFDGIEEARARSPLPAGPDAEAAGAVLLGIHRLVLGLKSPGAEVGPRILDYSAYGEHLPMWAGMEVRTGPRDGEAVEIGIDESGAVRLGDAAVTLDELMSRMHDLAGRSEREMLRGKPSRFVASIAFGAATPWQHVLWVMSVCSEVGYGKFEFAEGGRQLRIVLPRGLDGIPPGGLRGDEIPSPIEMVVAVDMERDAEGVAYRLGREIVREAAAVDGCVQAHAAAARRGACSLIGEIRAGHDVPAASVLDVLGTFAKHGAAEVQWRADAIPGEKTRRRKTLPPPR
ncbi:MAG: nucleotidyltransferase domain-containing protein [Planctomycetes bacterium]|nr:nucleotidyltransferase domain-containing protein [Planctomycetota bacterium]